MLEKINFTHVNMMMKTLAIKYPVYSSEFEELIQTHHVESIVNFFVTDTWYKVQEDKMPIFREAFLHKSSVEGSEQLSNNLRSLQSLQSRPLRSYENLEFLGDSYIHCILTKYLFERFKPEHENMAGFYTKLRQRLESNNALADYASFFGFQRFIVVENESLSRKIMEDVFEAFVGAMSLVFPIFTLEQFVYSILDNLVNFSTLLQSHINFKDTLLRYYQAQKWGFPKYYLLSSEITETNKQFVCGILVKREFFSDPTLNIHTLVGEEYTVLATGQGCTKKIAEQLASQNSMEILGIDKDY